MSSQSPNYRGIDIPKVSFGNIDSDALFGPNEQVIFDFYEQNARRYKQALDIGANIGVHTILMRRLGWTVIAFEPDPKHFAEGRKNVAAHCGDLKEGEFQQYAVSDESGLCRFVRQLGNTTGSHIKGDKNPYGALEEIEVYAVDCRTLFLWADFAKIDCEGHEARLLATVTENCRCEFMVEVGNPENAAAIWEHFWPTTYKLYAQKRGWSPCRYLPDVPKHHSEGSLFIGRNPPFPTST